MRGLSAVILFIFLTQKASAKNDLQEELASRVEQFVQGTAYNMECGDIHRQA